MQKEKRTFSLKKKFTATPEQKVGLPVKRANGINGGKPVGRYRLWCAKRSLGVLAK
jgi:hypothetical protein